MHSKKNHFFFGCGHADLRNQFMEIARKQSPEPRTVHSFMTTAIVRTLPILSIMYSLFVYLLAYRSGHSSHG
jgi:hypothetical protein